MTCARRSVGDGCESICVVRFRREAQRTSDVLSFSSRERRPRRRPPVLSGRDRRTADRLDSSCVVDDTAGPHFPSRFRTQAASHDGEPGAIGLALSSRARKNQRSSRSASCGRIGAESGPIAHRYGQFVESSRQRSRTYRSRHRPVPEGPTVADRDGYRRSRCSVISRVGRDVRDDTVAVTRAMGPSLESPAAPHLVVFRYARERGTGSAIARNALVVRTDRAVCRCRITRVRRSGASNTATVGSTHTWGIPPVIASLNSFATMHHCRRTGVFACAETQTVRERGFGSRIGRPNATPRLIRSAVPIFRSDRPTGRGRCGTDGQRSVRTEADRTRCGRVGLLFRSSVVATDTVRKWITCTDVHIINHISGYRNGRWCCEYPKIRARDSRLSVGIDPEYRADQGITTATHHP